MLLENHFQSRMAEKLFPCCVVVLQKANAVAITPWTIQYINRWFICRANIY